MVSEDYSVEALSFALSGTTLLLVMIYQLYKTSVEYQTEKLPRNVLFRWYFLLMCLPLIIAILLCEIDIYFRYHKHLLTNHKLIRQLIVYVSKIICTIAFFCFCLCTLFWGKITERLKRKS